MMRDLIQDPNVPKKEGVMMKRGGGKGGSKNWKVRFFSTNAKSIYYYKDAIVCLPLVLTIECEEK